MLTKQLIKFRDLFLYARAEELEDSYLYVYIENYDNLTLDSDIILDDSPDVDDNLIELFPKKIVELNYEVLCDAQIVQDVVSNVLSQVEYVSDECLLKAVIYYLKNDDFMIVGASKNG